MKNGRFCPSSFNSIHISRKPFFNDHLIYNVDLRLNVMEKLASSMFKISLKFFTVTVSANRNDGVLIHNSDSALGENSNDQDKIISK